MIEESRSDYNGGEPDLKRVMGPKLLLLFIVGDILGTGVYALTGQVAGEVGGAAWAPFLVAFVVATITAVSYLELVTQYPQAAGAALYTHKAFGVHFLTFLVAFTVMCSGITSASTAAQRVRRLRQRRLRPRPRSGGVGLDCSSRWASCCWSRLVNFRGVGESVQANVVLTLVELSGLLLVIFVGLWAVTQGKRRLRAGRGLRDRPTTRASSSRSRPRPRWRSSPWSASRTRSTWPRSATTRAATSPR